MRTKIKKIYPSVLLVMLLTVVLVTSNVEIVLATGADAMWTQIQTLIGTWVTRLGGVVIFIGLIMFGLGWKNEDADARARGVQTIIAGAIVTAAAGMIAVFFA